MDQTFITIHNLTPNANILFASDSVADILGYEPHEVQGRSCFDFFHPDEVPFARSVHSRGVLLDKAAVLHYARIRSRDERWVNCECCFTIVHDVLVASTSVYRRSEKSDRRAVEAPQIRRLFSCSIRDPRFHMLEHLSPKFQMPATEREPRAALILNRFTRSLSIMFSTNAVAAILGLSPDDLCDKSFYDCIQEACLNDAFRCLEGAKANDSIAYLRFWSRDPRRPEEVNDEESNSDEDDNELKGEQYGGDDMQAGIDQSIVGDNPNSWADETSPMRTRMDIDAHAYSPNDGRANQESMMGNEGGVVKRSSSEPPIRRLSDIPWTDSQEPLPSDGPEPILPETGGAREDMAGRHPRYPAPSYELEAVVSCTSDGLVVVLRRARPPHPAVRPPKPPALENGLFAAPWAQNPLHTNYRRQSFDSYQARPTLQQMFTGAGMGEARIPPVEQLMESIRDVAVFAWALVGINENLAAYGRGLPKGEATPHDRLYDQNDDRTRIGTQVDGNSGTFGECLISAGRRGLLGTGSREDFIPRNTDWRCSCAECQIYQPPSQQGQPALQSGFSRLRRSLNRPSIRSHGSTSSLPLSSLGRWSSNDYLRPRDRYRGKGDARNYPYSWF